MQLTHVFGVQALGDGGVAGQIRKEDGDHAPVLGSLVSVRKRGQWPFGLLVL
ncbi:MAG: hypothetical protein V1772_07725 [Chloroflexota bacterium]